MSSVKLENICKTFGAHSAVQDLNLTIKEGEFLALLGPSGCGKTTALRMISGFEEPTSGRIVIDGEDVSRIPPHKRNAGMVFQDYALFPHMTVAENIAFGLRERKWAEQKIKARVGELLDLIKLSHLHGRHPGEMSGGQQQRVALARALAFYPKVLLMDEPFGALDLKLRDSLQHDIVQIQRSLGITTIFVTHDQGEAMTMAHRIAVMNGGRLAQLGTPEEIYLHPSSTFVAKFVGKVNLFEGSVINHREGEANISVQGTRIGAPAKPWMEDGGRAMVALRPEWIRCVDVSAKSAGEKPAGRNQIAGILRNRRFLGNIQYMTVECGALGDVIVETRGSDEEFSLGSEVLVEWDFERSVVMECGIDDV